MSLLKPQLRGVLRHRSTAHKSHRPLATCIGILLTCLATVQAFSSSDNSNPKNTPTLNLFDRFRAVCPADISCIEQFDPSLVSKQNQEEDDYDQNLPTVWVAVYRSSNNQPSVLVKDEFLQAMRSATNVRNLDVSMDDTNKSAGFLEGSSTKGVGFAKTQQTKPVAVARLVPSADDNHKDEGVYVLDSMRCILKKENTDTDCDGGSEHTEAIAIAIDALLEHYLSSPQLKSVRTQDSKRGFDGAIRTKATLVSARLLEDRGFAPVQKLERDMATHVSNWNTCMERYAARSISSLQMGLQQMDEENMDTGATAKSPGAAQRALNIVSLLGQIEPGDQKDSNSESDENEDYDPWAGMKQFL